MERNGCQETAGGGEIIAAIDIGSHTARLLISKRVGSQPLFCPILRKRDYIRLAEGFGSSGNRDITREAVDRALGVIHHFAAIAKDTNVDIIRAVATGVVRAASNREWFLERIFKKTGIKVTVISGEREAMLTRKGVLSFLQKSGDESPVIFDLGGGTTEFIVDDKENVDLSSVPLGALVLTQAYLGSEPPEDGCIESLKRYIDDILITNFSGKEFNSRRLLMVGSGGTITTLAAILNSIDVKEITPGNINGLVLKRDMIEDLFLRMKSQSINERLEITGMDRDRAGVILAGTLAVIRILYFFNAVEVTVSFSDILEGMSIAYLQGE